MFKRDDIFHNTSRYHSVFSMWLGFSRLSNLIHNEEDCQFLEKRWKKGFAMMSITDENKERKKILILANSSIGLYKFRKDLIEELIEYGYEVVASTPVNGMLDELTAIGCRLIQTNFARRSIGLMNELKLYKKYKEIIRNENPNLVITYTIKPNIYGGFACKKCGVEYACNITGLGTAFERGGFLKKMAVELYKRSIKGVKVVFFENTSNRDLFVKLGILKEEKTHVLHGAGVNLSKFEIKPYPNNDCFRFLFVGRVMVEKGVKELLNAFSRLRKEGYNCSLDIVGGSLEDLGQEMEKSITTAYVFAHGYQRDVGPFIENCDCFVLPSYHEGMANTNLECAASGRPIITSDIPGCREAVLENVSGLLCQPKNAEDLYEKMKTMLLKSRQEREAMGMEVRKHMEKVFDKKLVVKETIETLGLM